MTLKRLNLGTFIRNRLKVACYFLFFLLNDGVFYVKRRPFGRLLIHLNIRVRCDICLVVLTREKVYVEQKNVRKRVETSIHHVIAQILTKNPLT